MKLVAKFLVWTVVVILAMSGSLIGIDALHAKACFDRPEPGTIISVPGEKIVVLEPDSGNPVDVLALDVVRDPFKDADYALPPEHGHIHPNQEERFEILSGRARFLIGDQYVDLEPGDVGVVPPNTNHHWMALDGSPVHAKAYFEPSLDVDMWFLHFQEHVSAGDMDLLQAAVISREYVQGSPVPADPPPAVWGFVSRVLAPIGRMLGYQAC